MTDTADFFRARLDGMVDPLHPLVVLSRTLPWAAIEQALAPHFAHKARPGQKLPTRDLLGEHEVEFGNGISKAGRPRLSIRLMVSLQYLKNAFNLSDEELVQRWSKNVVWQFFNGMAYYEPRLPCDATQIGRFRRAVGEEGLRATGSGLNTVSLRRKQLNSLAICDLATWKKSVRETYGFTRKSTLN